MSNVARPIFTLTVHAIPASLPEICRDYSPELKIIALEICVHLEFSRYLSCARDGIVSSHKIPIMAFGLGNMKYSGRK